MVRVQAFATINGEDITTSLAADALKSLKSVGSKNQLSILQIQEEVSKYYHVPLKDLKGKTGENNCGSSSNLNVSC